jgi:hypothetical protein
LKIIASEALAHGEYHLVQRFILKAENSNDVAIKLLEEWSSWGNQDEKDLFIVRMVLMKLAVNRLEDAKFIHEHYKSKYST